MGSEGIYSVSMNEGRAIASVCYLDIDCGHGVPAAMQAASVVVMEEFYTTSELWLPK